MSEGDKPFACTVPGCGQTFTNNDRLTIHRQTHSLRVKIGPKSEEIIPDQTPTPTRFLRNCDEEGLFEELEHVDNPFEKDFKKNLSSQQTHEKRNLENSVVHTPVPTLADIPLSNKESITVDVVTIENNDEDVGPPSVMQNVVIEDQPDGMPNATDFLRQTVEQVAESEQDTKMTDKSPTVSVLVAQKNTIPRKVIPPFIAHPDIAVPKATPAPNIAHNGANLHSIPTRAIVVTPPGKSPTGSFVKSAKQILKETIRIHQSQGKDVKTNLGNIISQAMNEAVTAVKRPSSTESENNSSNEDKDPKPIKRNRRSQDELSADEKRERFLERNRAAATRCREKRKLWIQALEKKAEEMSDLNSQLQNEISCLKHEVAQLKALLLAHRDCPLSINQQKAHPGIFEQLQGATVVIDIPRNSQQTAEADASSALAQMAERAAVECNM